jgi:dTDP-4-amino-4,6-dideoxygalactose transaminase
LGNVALPKDVPGHIYNQFVICCAARDGLRTFLREQGVESEIYYPVPLHLQECFRNLNYWKGEFPLAETAAGEALALPIYPELTEAQQRYVVDKICGFYWEHRTQGIEGIAVTLE